MHGRLSFERGKFNTQMHIRLINVYWHGLWNSHNLWNAWNSEKNMKLFTWNIVPIFSHTSFGYEHEKFAPINLATCRSSVLLACHLYRQGKVLHQLQKATYRRREGWRWWYRERTCLRCTQYYHRQVRRTPIAAWTRSTTHECTIFADATELVYFYL